MNPAQADLYPGGSMPRISRSVSQRYASASQKKPRRRAEAHAHIVPPQVPTPAIEVAPGFGSPSPLELPSQEPAPPARTARAAARAEARAMTRGEIRHAQRRLTTA